MQSLIIPCLRKSSNMNQAMQILTDVLAPLSNYNNLPHKFVQELMDGYEKKAASGKIDRSVHGRFFEYAIGEVLAQEKIMPLYYQAQLRHVPLAIFDWLLYDAAHPIVVSCKTKARDRWKQAAYEAMALKRVYTRSTNYLVTIEALPNTDDKKAEADIDHYLIATDKEFSDAIKEIARRKFSVAEDVSPMLKGDLVV